MEPLAMRADRREVVRRRLSPTTPGERIQVVDALRGLALLGILIENMAPYAGYSYDPQVGGPLTLRTIVGVAVLFFLESKSYSVLALLLGWGAAVQERRATARGVRFAPFFLRRAGVLLVFGLAHGILVWFGDILILYALLSVFLLLLYAGARRLIPDRADGVILAVSLCALCLPILLTIPGDTLDAVRAWYEDLTSVLRSSTHPESVYANGSYWQALGRRMQDLSRSWSWVLYYVGNVLSVILIGFYLGRKEILNRGRERASSLRKMVWIGLGVGVPLNVVYVATTLGLEHALGRYHGLVRIGARTVGSPALVLALFAGLTLALRQRGWQRRLETVALAGRMSLSNYLFQSLACTLLYYGYGLKLYGQIGPVFGLVLAVLLYGVQLQLCKWWLDRWSMGPAEWLWRVLAYGRARLTSSATGDRGKDGGGRTARRAVWVGLLLVAVVVVLLAVGVVALLPEGLPRLGDRTPRETRPTGPTPIVKSETAVSATRDVGRDESPDALPLVTPQSWHGAYQPGPLAASGDLVALASTLDPSSIHDKIEVLTGPPHLGRYPVSSGGRAAGDYIAVRFSSYGLQPAGDAGTFFQSFPVEYVALSSVPRLAIERADGTTVDGYVPYRDYAVVLRWYSGGGEAAGPAVWANNCAREDFDLDVVDKVVLCRTTSIPEAQRYALEHGASGLLLLTDALDRPPDFGSRNGEAWVSEPIPTFRVFSRVAADLVRGSGRSLQDLSTAFDSFALESRVSMRVGTKGAEVCPQERCLARNVLGVLPGRDPQLAHQVVVVGAHYDHLGESPDGTVWAGANDNASGVAVLLEIAQRWHEQGYVPRRTVLFCAWDAEEMGLLGSRYYVEHPRYSLESTVAMLQLDMVGAGEFPLRVDGRGRLADSLTAIADDLGIEISRTDAGRSDHVPFQEAGIPASLLIWSYEEGPGAPAPTYHRPVDVAAEIDLQKLEAVSRVASLSLLALTEGEPALVDLIDLRAQAANAGELEAFLATSSPDQWDLDEGWFSALQSVDPTAVSLELADARVLGRTATGTVRADVKWVDAQGRESDSQTSMAVRFEHDGQRWLWAGPDLERVALVEPEPNAAPALDARFTILAPPGSSSALLGADLAVAQRYTEITGILGLTSEIDATLMLFGQAPALWASVSPIVDDRNDRGWTGFRVAKIAHSPDPLLDAELDTALVHLALAEGGVTQEAAPWLWRGLPLAVRSELEGSPPTYLAHLERDLVAQAAADNLDAGDETWTDATAWAAVEHLRNEIGWPALGRFVQSLGMACWGGRSQGVRRGLCSNPRALEEALSTVGYADAAAFESAWRGHWDRQIRELRAGLESTLAARSVAIQAGDLEAFLRTVDARVPQLVAEQQGWFDDLVKHPVEELVLEGQPLALYKDGFVADVSLSYRPTADGGRRRPVQATTLIEFTTGQAGYLWAGVPFEAMEGTSIRLLYPGPLSERAELYRALATEALPEAEWMLDQMTDELNLELVNPLTLKIYERGEDRQASIGLSLLSGSIPPGGSASRSSVKLSLSAESERDGFRSLLAAQLARQLLYQVDVDSEWLVRGVSLYLASLVDGGIVRRDTEAALDDLLKAVTRERLYALPELPPGRELTPSEIRIANAQTLDVISYLIRLYGHQTLQILIDSRPGHDLDFALQHATGHTLAELEADWSESLARGHARPEWIEIAQAFDESAAYRHVVALTGLDMAGRQAGSRGEEQTAAYIATRFAEYGLIPVIESSARASASPANPFMQRFPIRYTTLTSLPSVELINNQGQTVTTLEYRTDFRAIVDPSSGAGTALGGLVWIEGSDWGDIDLNGKIAVQRSSGSLPAQIDRAVRHNASALLLVGKRGGQRSILSKRAFPVTSPLSQTLPVLELTPKGQERLLRACGWTVGDLDTFPAAQELGLDARLEVPLSEPVAAESSNVLGLLPGTDPELSKQVILLGAHYDHVGDDPDGVRYSGANDNASGVAVLLQIAHLWQQTGYRPKHSVLFAAWGAQEPGEVGSRFYVAHPLLPLDQMVAVIQLDAVGGGRGYFLEAQGDPDREGLLRFTMEASEAWVDGRLTLTRPLGKSDHVPFREAGIPGLLLTWRESSDENLPDHRADPVEPYRLGVTGRMLVLTLMALAG